MINKWITAVMTAALVLLCAGCNRNTTEIDPMLETGSTLNEVSIQILDIEATNDETILYVQWQNNSRHPVMYGESFGLQRWEQDHWINCPMKENTGFTSIGYMLDPGKSVIKSYTLNWAFGELIPGKYQFLTSCHMMQKGNNKECKLSDAFVFEGLTNAHDDIKGEFSSPPKLTISNAGEAVTGTYSWSWAMGDGRWSHVCADSTHPLLMGNHLVVIHPDNGSVDLNFEAIPDNCTVHCWPGSAFGDPNSKSEAVTVRNNAIQLKKGDYIYEVNATWNDNGTGYYGTVTYVFYAAPKMAYDVMPIDGEIELYIAGETLVLDSERSKTVRTVLSSLVFREEAVCDCVPEYNLLINGISYGIHLQESYVRCNKGQAALTPQQLTELTAIIDWALEETKAR